MKQWKVFAMTEENGRAMKVDVQLLAKYGRPGPRYTSYPTAPHFTSAFGPEDYRSELIETNRDENMADLSLYFHIPFCNTLCYFCACNTIITHDAAKIADYVGLLRKEIDMVSGLVNPNRKVVQLHWGGGTPSYLSPAQITDLFAYINEKFSFAGGAEISMEIDPRDLTPQHLPAIRKAGFNRVSFGVQDLDVKVQETINRVQPMDLNRRVIEESRDLGFESVNLDLIYGLPYQTVESFSRTLERVLEFSPDRLAVFNYAHVPWMKKHQRMIPADALPTPEERLQILKLVIERLTAAGYTYIGMDHFARQDDDLTVAMNNGTLHRNFQGYTTHAGSEVYAMGITAISQLDGVYAQNVKSIPEYREMLRRDILPTQIGVRLDEDDKLRRYVINEIMCNGRVLKSAVLSRFGVDFDDYFGESLARLDDLVADGLVSLREDRLQVHPKGRLVLRNIAMAFDRYLQEDHPDSEQKFSRTV
jgi:oxygen-independent coproporphyrinogen-3 oxidase